MKPLKVEFQAFGPYAGYEKVDFEKIAEKGLFLICGKTGTGKTMILDAITFALFGKSSGSGRDDFESMRCTKADDSSDTFVKFEFENNGSYFIFERRLEKKRKNFSKVFKLLKMNEDGVYEPLYENTKEKNLNEKATEIIGLSYEQFVQVIVLPQGKFEKLLTSNSNEKEEILTSIFGEEKWQHIADKVYEEASERINSLKSQREKIEMSLSEEGCKSVAELYGLIDSKTEELNRVTSEFEDKNFDKELEKQQELLTVAGRFESLKRAEELVADFESRRTECEQWEIKYSEATRAEKVRTLIDGVLEAEKSLKKRSDALELCKLNEANAHNKLEESKNKYDECLKQENEIKEQNTLKIQYEGKRATYVEIDNVKKEHDRAVDDARKIKEALDLKKGKYEAFTPAIERLTAEWEQLNTELDKYLKLYVAGVSGVLASQLLENTPCPVCGSTTHPKKAVMSAESVTDAELNEKKKNQDDKYVELQSEIAKSQEAKSEYDSVKAQSEKMENDVAVIKARMDSMRENMADGIDCLEMLDERIAGLDKSINSYEKQKEMLEADYKKASEALTEARAKIEPDEKEMAEAADSLKSAEEALKAGLIANGFDNQAVAQELLMDEADRESLKTKIDDFAAGYKQAKENAEVLKSQLNGIEPPDVDKCREIIDSINAEKTVFTEATTALKIRIDSLSEKAKKLESLGENIEEKLKEAENDYAFAKSLRGDTGTGLQRYVLGIMFSSVVAAANKMLEMVHDGRYRLFRTDEKALGTNKRGLELKVYDKYSEESDGRFVNTLSGGEKFLASLALSIGMSTVAQKSGIKIDALFIDEGFGSLDEDSIGDAMNILNSIQAANGLVGIISHVQLLQDRIPTKLHVVEKENGSHIVQSVG